MTIVSDLDNCLNNQNVLWIAYLNNKYGLSVKIDDIKTYDLPKYFPSLTEEQVYEPLFLSEFQRSLRPTADSQKYLSLLHMQGHEIMICTKAYPRIFEYKAEFIGKYFPFIKEDNIGRWTKKQMINCDAMVDDHYLNLVGGKFKRILFTQFWNKDIDVNEYQFYRANNWKQCYELIN